MGKKREEIEKLQQDFYWAQDAIRELRELLNRTDQSLCELLNAKGGSKLTQSLVGLQSDLHKLSKKTPLPSDSYELVNELNGRVGRCLDFYHGINKRLMNVENKLGIKTHIGGNQNEIKLSE